MGRRALAIVILVLGACTSCTGKERPSAPDASAPGVASGAPVASVVPVASAFEPEPFVPRAPVPAPAPVDTWVWKPFLGDHFTMLFPGGPRLSRLPAEEDRAAYTEAKLDMPGGQVSFAAGFTDHTEDEVKTPEKFLDDRANAPRRGSTDVLHKRSITLPGGHPGRVLILRRDISGTPLRIYSRLYLVKRRLYSLIVSTLDVGGVSEDVVKKFMESFKLL